MRAKCERDTFSAQRVQKDSFLCPWHIAAASWHIFTTTQPIICQLGVTSLPNANDVTLSSLYRPVVTCRATRALSPAADIADADKREAHSCQIRTSLHLSPAPSVSDATGILHLYCPSPQGSRHSYLVLIRINPNYDTTSAATASQLYYLVQCVCCYLCSHSASIRRTYCDTVIFC